MEQVSLYDEYVLYTIIFDIKGTLDKETKELYNKYVGCKLHIKKEK